MKRDPDLIREILLRVEEAPYGTVRSHDPALLLFGGHADEPTVAHHMLLLEEGGYLDASIRNHPESAGPVSGVALRLTWEGHDFLDAARDEGRWEKAKEITREKSGALSFEAVKTVVAELAKIGLQAAVRAGGAS